MLAAVGLLFAKAVGIGLIVVVIESSFAKLRLFKIPEFTVASFLLAVLAVVMFLFQPSFGATQLTVFGAAATVTAVLVLLVELATSSIGVASSILVAVLLSAFAFVALRPVHIGGSRRYRWKRCRSPSAACSWPSC